MTQQQYEELINQILASKSQIQTRIENCYISNASDGVSFFKGLISLTDIMIPEQSHDRWVRNIIVEYCNKRIPEVEVEIAEWEKAVAEQKETARLTTLTLKYQNEHYPMLIDESKKRKQYFWINLLVGGGIGILGTVLGILLSKDPINPIVLPSIQIVHDTVYLSDSLRH